MSLASLVNLNLNKTRDMKIAQIVCVFPPYPGGIGNVAYYFSKVLDRLSHQVTVLTPDYKINKFFKNTKLENIELGNVDVLKLKSILTYGKGVFLPQLFLYLKNFDIIHLHYPFFGTAEIVWLYKLLHPKTKLIIHYHMDVVNLPLLAKILSFPSKLIRTLLLKSADKITCASLDYIKNSDIANFYQNHKDKFYEIPFGIDIEEFKIKNKKEEKDKKNILFVGTLDKAHYFKGLEYLLNAVSKLQDIDFQLLIIGNGDRREHYENLAKKLNIKDKVVFVGFVDNKKLVRYYNLADVFVFPSIDKSEAFGMVLLEAMACGIPVIASNIPGVRSVFKDKEQGYLVEPRNIKDLSSKLNKILSNKKIRLEMSIKARKLVERKYSLKTVKERLNKIYENLLD